MLKAASIYLAAMCLGGAAFAQCTGWATGVGGQTKYISPDMKYCNGTSWVSMGGGGGGTPGGSNGHVQFNNSSAFGGDSALFWNNTNKRLGIGTASPAQVLDVNGNINAAYGVVSATATHTNIVITGTATVQGSALSVGGSTFVATAGKVGIGTTTPAYTLDVSGTIRSTGNLTVGGTLDTGWELLSSASMSVSCSSGKKVLGGASNVTCANSDLNAFWIAAPALSATSVSCGCGADGHYWSGSCQSICARIQ